jgi:hypothetical protein
MDEKPVAQTVAGAWIAWERRYNTELVLLVSVLILLGAVIQIMLTLGSQTTPAPSQPDPAITLHHGSVGGGSHRPSLNEPQSESCSPSSSHADGLIQLLPGDDKTCAQVVSIRHAEGPFSVRERASGLGSGGGEDLNLRPLGYEHYDARLPRLGRSPAATLTSGTSSAASRQGCHVFAVSHCPVASGLQIGLQSRSSACGFLSFERG